ncbi:MAG: ABC transporter ATP-binding protein [Oscillospiraceae bacterium]
MVSIRNLTKRYDAVSVLRGLNMNINRGDVYGFLGRNGSGKTTTMNIITNIIPKDSGEIILGEGQPVTVGYLPESPVIYGYMTAKEYLEYIAYCCRYSGNIDKRVDQVLDIIGLSASRNMRAKTFSRGMTQRLGMGAAIIGNPELLLFDEPTSALDPQGRTEVIEIINNLKSTGATIILSTHILHDVERVANRIGIMNNGIIAEEGDIADLLKKYGASRITMHIRDLTHENKLKLLGVDFAAAAFDSNSAAFTFSAQDIDDCTQRLLRLLADEQIIPLDISVGAASLEEVYRKVVG